MTLIEIMVVLVIVSLVSAGIAVGAYASLAKAKVKNAGIQATNLRQAAVRSLLEHDECPTPQGLLDAHVLDEGSNLLDGWDRPYQITCEGDHIEVRSSGPDQKMGTPDDIIVPGLVPPKAPKKS